MAFLPYFRKLRNLLRDVELPQIDSRFFPVQFFVKVEFGIFTENHLKHAHHETFFSD